MQPSYIHIRKVWTVLIALLAISFAAEEVVAQVSVRGYHRKDGTYVRPHQRTAPNSNPYDNYSFPGNYNPNTGQITGGNPDTYLRNYYDRSGGTGDVWVDGYFRDDGTYVQGHYRTRPDGDPYNNYSYPGNYNPNTGSISSGSPEAYLRRYYKSTGYNIRGGVSTLQAQLYRLGFDPGPTDGVWGNQTRVAVQRFQRSANITADGVVGPETMRHLSARDSETQGSLAPPRGHTSRSELRVPANAVVVGDQWFCANGYRKVGQNCERVVAPANAVVVGDQWFCANGYRKVGQNCERR